MSELKIESIGEYIDLLRQAYTYSGSEFKGLWYRGHADGSWVLEPKIQRGFEGTEEELFRKERKLTNEFQTKASVISGEKPPLNDYGAWLTLMQHYGLPTRLMDWSRSPLVALYFAVSDEKKMDTDACIWVLEPHKLNESMKLEKPTADGDVLHSNTFVYNMSHKTINTMLFTAFRRWKLSSDPSVDTLEDKKFDHRFKDLSGKIAACYPTMADNRVYNQYSAFTVHNTDKRFMNFCFSSEPKEMPILHRIIVPYDVKKLLRRELELCGFTQSHIYPDYEHLAKEIIEDQGDKRWF
jgi:hypothetical protein